MVKDCDLETSLYRFNRLKKIVLLNLGRHALLSQGPERAAAEEEEADAVAGGRARGGRAGDDALGQDQEEDQYSGKPRGAKEGATFCLPEFGLLPHFTVQGDKSSLRLDFVDFDFW